MSRNSPGCHMVLSWWRGILKSLSATPVCWCLWGAQVRRAPQDLLFTVFLTLQEAVQCSKVCYPITVDWMKTTSNCHTKNTAIHNKNILTTKMLWRSFLLTVVRPWVSTNHILALWTTGFNYIAHEEYLGWHTRNFLWVSSDTLKLTRRRFVCSRMALKAVKQSWIRASSHAPTTLQCDK